MANGARAIDQYIPDTQQTANGFTVPTTITERR
jgi:hypothetical protein